MSLERKLEHIKKRKWDVVRDAWMRTIPVFPGLGARPDPGLEKLPTLQAVKFPEKDEPPARHADVDGIRHNALWDAVFLFHKCAHANLAAQRLGERGMHSWSMFNAYHSAYLGAKGIMEMLGVAVISPEGKHIVIDLFPEPDKASRMKPTGVKVNIPFNDFRIIRLDGLLDQQGLWEAFQRVLRVSAVTCWDPNLNKELVNLTSKKITPQRNGFLYKAHYWPMDDLMADGSLEQLNILVGTELDVNHQGFLLRLCFSIYRLFEQLMLDFSSYSAVIKHQFEGSRVLMSAGLPVLGTYATFVSQLYARVE